MVFIWLDLNNGSNRLAIGYADFYSLATAHCQQIFTIDVRADGPDFSGVDDGAAMYTDEHRFIKFSGQTFQRSSDDVHFVTIIDTDEIGRASCRERCTEEESRAY